MILVVGHGPSAEVDPEWVDSQSMVVRLFTGSINKGKGEFVPTVGTKTDVIVTPQPKRVYPGPLWWVESDYRERLRKLADPYTTKKLSTGTMACLIAHMEHDDEIGVIGFDTTFRGVRLGDWPYHDAGAEQKLLLSIGVKDYGKDV